MFFHKILHQQSRIAFDILRSNRAPYLQTLAMGFEDLDYTTIADVIDSWEQLRRTPDYALTAGTLLFSQ